MKHLMLLLLLPVSVSAQYGFQLKGDKIYIERTFYLREKSDKEIFNSLKIAILDEVKSERLIENIDHSMNKISANGMFEYYTKRKNKNHPTHECGYRIYGKVLNGIYTIRVTDFIGKIKDRAGSNINYDAEYKSLYVYMSSAKRNARIQNFESFENGIMEVLSSISSSVGVTSPVINGVIISEQ